MTTTNATLLERVRVLAAQRAAAAQLAALLKAEQEAFDAKHADLIAGIQQACAAVNDSELMVRTLAVDAYNANPDDKAPAPGIGIRVTKNYTVDEKAGLVWAKQAGMCLIPESLDVKAVKKIAAATPLAFVTVTEEASATIATDLEKALADVPAPEAVTATAEPF